MIGKFDEDSGVYVSYVRRKRRSGRQWPGWVIFGVALAALWLVVDMRFHLVLFAVPPDAVGSSSPADATAVDVPPVEPETPTSPSADNTAEPVASVASSSTKAQESEPSPEPTPPIETAMPDWGDADGFISKTTDTEVAVPTAADTAKVVWILDGDTIDVLLPNRSTVRLRLSGIDAPETDQPFGNAAKGLMMQAIAGRIVHVRTFGEDRYGRTIAEVFLRGRSVNLELVKAGYAWHYRQQAEGRHDLQQAERAARAARRGIWSSRTTPTPPWEWRRQSDR